MLVCVAALIYSGVWYFVTSETRAEVATLNDQIVATAGKERDRHASPPSE